LAVCAHLRIASALGANRATPFRGSTSTGGTKATGGTVSTGGTKLTGGATAVRLVRAARRSHRFGAARQRPSPGLATSTQPATRVGCRPQHGAGSLARVQGEPLPGQARVGQHNQDIGILASGSFADSAVQDTFCSGTTCTISIIYDQSGKATTSPKPRRAREKAHQITKQRDCSQVYRLRPYGLRVHIVAGDGYRNDSTSGIATATSRRLSTGYKRYLLQQWCCFDYGNAETNNKDDGGRYHGSRVFRQLHELGKVLALALGDGGS